MKMKWLVSAIDMLLVGCAALAVVFCHPVDSSRLPKPTMRDAVRSGRFVEIVDPVPVTVTTKSACVAPLNSAERQQAIARIRLFDESQCGVSDLLHLLRIHGIGSHPHSGRFKNGIQMIQLLCDESAGNRYFGRHVLVKTAFGACFPTIGMGNTGPHPERLESHRDQTLAALAQLGVPLTQQLTINGQTLAVKDVLRDSVAQFHLGQREMAWTTIAYALYLPPTRQWTNRFGESYDLDALAENVMSRSFQDESCAGTHLIEAATVLALADRHKPVLSDPTRDHLWSWLAVLARRMVKNQDVQGYWDLNWWKGKEETPAEDPWQELDEREVFQMHLLATGHLIEWIRILPADMRPGNEALEKANYWLYQALMKAGDDDIKDLFCPYTHAAIALK